MIRWNSLRPVFLLISSLVVLQCSCVHRSDSNRKSFDALLESINDEMQFVDVESGSAFGASDFTYPSISAAVGHQRV